MKTIIGMIKILFITVKAKPDQRFINELYAHEQAKFYQRHAGIGNGPKDLPDGVFIKRSTKSF